MLHGCEFMTGTHSNTSLAESVLAKLSEREVDVFTRLARGESQADIRRDLSLSHSAVSEYRRRVMVKLDLRTNVDLILLAHRCGLTRGEE